MKKILIIFVALVIIGVTLIFVFDKDDEKQQIKNEKKIDSVMKIDKQNIDSLLQTKKGIGFIIKRKSQSKKERVCI